MRSFQPFLKSILGQVGSPNLDTYRISPIQIQNSNLKTEKVIFHSNPTFPIQTDFWYFLVDFKANPQNFTEELPGRGARAEEARLRCGA